MLLDLIEEAVDAVDPIRVEGVLAVGFPLLAEVQDEHISRALHVRHAARLPGVGRVAPLEHTHLGG